MTEVRFGTSGWSYNEWIGPFYKDKKTRKLSHYSSIFSTAEINSTFYAYPKRGTVFGWWRFTDPNFVFSAKLPRVITHQKKLKVEDGVTQDVIRFTELLQPLWSNGKLGPLLIQLPPSLDMDLQLLKEFFKILPKEFNFAIEFRHLSWWNEETWKLLRKYNVANTIVDEPLLPSDPVVTANFAYIRWHGHGERIWYDYHYDDNELKPWISKIEKIKKKTKTIYGYFNNHFHGYAVDNCLTILEMLNVISPEQMNAKNKVNRFLRNRPEESQKQLTLYSTSPLEDLILGLSDVARLKRAKEIPNDELSISEFSPDKVEAKVKNYKIVIDVNEQFIRHDCDDWSRQASRKKICKHLGKLFLSLPQDFAKEILEEIRGNKEEWKFIPINKE